MANILERYAGQIHGTISCFDRVILFGSLPEISHLGGMVGHLKARNIPLETYYSHVMELRDKIVNAAKDLAKANGIKIQYIRKSSIRKEEIVEAELARHGSRPGLVCILSALESCHSYELRRQRKTVEPQLMARGGACLHYYFYFMDEDLGLCHVRVPTWCPFRLQVYFNGHFWLASKLLRNGVAYKMEDNAFRFIGDFENAQRLSDDLNIPDLKAKLDAYASLCCPVTEAMGLQYYWSISQLEYATDIIFKDPADLRHFYDRISRELILSLKPDKVAAFYGRRFPANHPREVETRFLTRSQGTCIKHTWDPVSIKMYDKFHLILRLETTTNDVTFFKHYRKVVQHDGQVVEKNAPVIKSIVSLPVLFPMMRAANFRYLDFISSLDDPTDGYQRLEKVSQPKTENGRNYRGLNFFSEDDQKLLRAIAAGEYAIYGMRNKCLRERLKLTSGQVSRKLKNLRVHSLIKKASRSYRYYLTALGKRVISAGLKIKELFLIPELSAGSS